MCFFQIVGQFDPAKYNELELTIATRASKMSHAATTDKRGAIVES